MKSKRSKTKDLVDSLQHLSIKPNNRRQNREKNSNFVLSVLLSTSQDSKRLYRPCFSDDMMKIFSIENGSHLCDRLYNKDNLDLSLHMNKSYKGESIYKTYNNDQYYSSAGVLHTCKKPETSLKTEHNEQLIGLFHRRYHSSVFNDQNESFSTYRSFSCFTSNSSLLKPNQNEIVRRKVYRLSSIDFERLRRVANIRPIQDLFIPNNFEQNFNFEKSIKSFKIKAPNDLCDFSQLINKSQKVIHTKDNESINLSEKSGSWRTRRCSDPQHWQSNFMNRLTKTSEDKFCNPQFVLSDGSVLKENDSKRQLPGQVTTQSFGVINSDEKDTSNSIKIQSDAFSIQDKLSNTKVNDNTDVTVNELASYMEHSLYFPGQLSEMAQRMYL